MKKRTICLLLAAALLAGGGLSGYTAQAAELRNRSASDAAEEPPASPEWIGGLRQAADAKQLFVVAGVKDTTAYVSMHEKDASGTWREILSTPGYIGKNGLGKEKEGDAKTPVGTFRFNAAFGIAADPGCALKYHQVTEDDYWSGDQREGYGYNTMVSLRRLPDLNVEDSEHLIDIVNEYQYCLNISYNEEGTPGLGSAIFLHCLGPVKPYTGGCVAIPKDQMIKVMQNVREDCVVVIDSLRHLSPETWDSLKLSPSFEGAAKASLSMGKTELTLVTDFPVQDSEGFYYAAEADIYVTENERYLYLGTAASGGTANPLAYQGGKLYAVGHHFVKSMRMEKGELITEEAREVFDKEGRVRYQYSCNDGKDYSAYDSSKALEKYDALMREYAGSEILRFKLPGEG